MKSQSIHMITSVSTIVVFLCAFYQLGSCRDDPFIRMETLGGAVNWAEIENIGRFAVQEHNKKENALLEFARVVGATEQVVAGKIYHLTLEAIDSGKRKVYDAKVWVKPWMNFKQLQEFRNKDSPLFTSADPGLKGESHEVDWSIVPTFDPVVKDAAVHAVKSIQNRSYSLFPYRLLEILKAKAKVSRDSTRFALILKVRRGSKDEKFKVVVNKSIGGVFYLNQMESDLS